ATVTHIKGKKKKTTAEKPSTALATTNGHNKAAVHTGQVVYTDKDLDKAVERVRECKKVAAVGLWALGEELRKINEDKLWKFRVVKGKAAYTSFNQFCNEEAKVSHEYAYKLIEISTRFTEADVSKFGTSKLTLMLKVADEDLPAVREVAERTGKRGLAKHVKQVIKERGHGAKKKNAKSAKASAASRTATAPIALARSAFCSPWLTASSR
ncbi:MAG: hypothetical protein V4555_18130, partial [Acidobacteriota bacterium]